MSASLSIGEAHQILAAIPGLDGHALALVLEAKGSTPAKAGARAIVDLQGRIQGTIGGGRVEAEACRRAPEVIRTGRPEVFSFGLDGLAATGRDPICGGQMRVLLDPQPGCHLGAYAAAAETIRQRQMGVLVTRVSGSPITVEVHFFAATDLSPGFGFPDGMGLGKVLERGEPRYWPAEPGFGKATVEIMAEPLVAHPRLLIAGGGHVGQAVAALAHQVGFEVTVLDDRTEFAAPDLYPAGVRTGCGSVVEGVSRLRPDADTYLVLVSRGHQQDAEVLAACIRAPIAYLGMIGSRRKVALLRAEFIATGKATAQEWDRVYAPIGLDIGSVTVPEIAVSIVAQLIAVRRQGQAPRIELPAARLRVNS